MAEEKKASIIYRATGNLHAVQILLGHSKIENTVRSLGIDVEDALALAEILKSESIGPSPRRGAIVVATEYFPAILSAFDHDRCRRSSPFSLY